MFVVMAVFLDHVSDGSKTGTVEEKFTHGMFPVIEPSNVDRLVQILAGRDNCVSIGVEHRSGSTLTVPSYDQNRKLS